MTNINPTEKKELFIVISSKISKLRGHQTKQIKYEKAPLIINKWINKCYRFNTKRMNNFRFINFITPCFVESALVWLWLFGRLVDRSWLSSSSPTDATAELTLYILCFAHSAALVLFVFDFLLCSFIFIFDLLR